MTKKVDNATKKNKFTQDKNFKEELHNKLEDKSSLNFNCPIDSKKITDTMKKYGQFGQIIINPIGHQKK